MRAKLIDVVQELDAHEERTIYIESLDSAGPGSNVLVLQEPESGDLPQAAVDAGYEYLLECSLALEVLGVWSKWRLGRAPSPDEACEAVIHYAVHDAYLPVQ